MTRALRHGFAAWAASAAVSTLGDSVTAFALVWVASRRGPGTAGLVLTAGSIPLAVLLLAGGLVADRLGARVVMTGCDLAMGVVLGAFAVGASWATPVWLLVLVSFLGGTAAGLRRPAAGVFPRLFARDVELTRRMATLTLLQQVAQVTGPVVGGALLVSGGLTLTSTVDAVSFVLVGVVLLLVRPPLLLERPSGSAGWWEQLREGVLAVRASPGARAAVLAVCGLAVAILPLVELCVPIAGHGRGWGAARTSVVVGAWPVGGMSVMAAVARLGRPGPRLAVAGALTAAVGAGLLATSSTVEVAVAAVLFVGVGTSMTTARLIPRFIDATPEPLLARFQSVLQLAQVVPVLLVTPLVGLASHRWGVGSTLLVLAGVLLATAYVVHRAEVHLRPLG